VSSARIAGGLVRSAQAAAVVGQETLAVAQHLRRLAAVIADIAALTHDRIDKEIPAGTDDPAGTRQTVAEKGPIGILRDGLGDARAKEQAREKPPEVNRIRPRGQVDAKLFRVEQALLEHA
jgi:hypothetical protein